MRELKLRTQVDVLLTRAARADTAEVDARELDISNKIGRGFYRAHS